MNRLIKTKLFETVESQEVISEVDFQNILEDFASQIKSICDNEKDCRAIFRTLTYSKTLLTSKTDNRIAKSAIELIDHELELLRLRIKHPKPFIDEQLKHVKSPLHLASSVKLCDLMEMFIPLDLLGMLEFENGSKASFAKLTESIEWLFNISFGNCYEKREDILIRKRQKTKFLDKLKVALEEHNKNNFSPNR